ncbi:MAG: histidine phosphatase family protein [Desulfovibrio sp.]|nr:histidine phosphatase family protein [Desulfovibrio sp.]
MDILLIRHGAIAWPKGTYLGTTDVPLSPRGYAQMTSLAHHLKASVTPKKPILISSDLTRCRESAAIVRSIWDPHMPLHIDPGFREINLGLWEGKSKKEIAQHARGSYLLRGHFFDCFVPPNGESFRMLKRRVLCSLSFWEKHMPQGLMCLITHAGVFRILLAHFLAMPLADTFRIPLDYGAYCTLTTGDRHE